MNKGGRLRQAHCSYSPDLFGHNRASLLEPESLNLNILRGISFHNFLIGIVTKTRLNKTRNPFPFKMMGSFEDLS